MNYADKQWPKLIVYLEDGRLRMDNNLVENAIRPYRSRKSKRFCRCRLTVTISQRYHDAIAQQEKPAVNATDTHSMPQVVPLAIDFDEDFIDEKCITVA